jgi:orotate phosphoribosyltransferase
MAIGADPIAQSVALSSLDDGGPEIPAFIVRPAPKDHGTREQTSEAFMAGGEPLLLPGRKVAIVDDVITTGGSVKGAIEAVQAKGCEVALVVVLVERHERGGEKLKAEGYNFRRLFYANEDGDLSIDDQLLRQAQELSGAGLLR